AKILVPETEKFDNTMHVNKEKMGANALEAISNGTTDGLKLAINVAAMLLVFTALIYMFNYFLLKTGDITHLNTWVAANTAYENLSFQFILGYIFAPISWLIGVPYADIVTVGQLLGEKTILNEFYAYATMGEMKANGIFHSEKSMIMATYILCGFSNVASIGIQIGGIGALVPSKRGQLSKLGVRALIGGTVASLFTAAVVGMFFS
ncbi:MAG: CNT family concentrative nucleoside transporter, partial [Salibacteraceae bacterium]